MNFVKIKSDISYSILYQNYKDSVNSTIYMKTIKKYQFMGINTLNLLKLRIIVIGAILFR